MESSFRRLVHQLSALLFSLLISFVLIQPVFGQSYEKDPEDEFLTLLNKGYGVDKARSELAQRFGIAVATEIAVWVCFDYEDACAEGESDVFFAWEKFLDEIEDEFTVAEAIQEMDDYDDYLINGIALFWCSPEPGAGCEADKFQESWLDFDYYLENNYDPSEAINRIASDAGLIIGELIAAANCGEATCYADYFDDADEDEPVFERMSEDKTPLAKERQSVASFANNPGRPKKGWLVKIKCKIRGGKNC
ncbi:MAG: hypothetical protein AB8G77_01230 [Rhodothermales bacterium]